MKKNVALILAVVLIPGGSVLLLAELARRAGVLEKVKKQINKMRRTK